MNKTVQNWFYFPKLKSWLSTKSLIKMNTEKLSFFCSAVKLSFCGVCKLDWTWNWDWKETSMFLSKQPVLQGTNLRPLPLPPRSAHISLTPTSSHMLSHLPPGVCSRLQPAATCSAPASRITFHHRPHGSQHRPRTVSAASFIPPSVSVSLTELSSSAGSSTMLKCTADAHGLKHTSGRFYCFMCAGSLLQAETVWSLLLITSPGSVSGWTNQQICWHHEPNKGYISCFS